MLHISINFDFLFSDMTHLRNIFNPILVNLDRMNKNLEDERVYMPFLQYLRKEFFVMLQVSPDRPVSFDIYMAETLIERYSICFGKT